MQAMHPRLAGEQKGAPVGKGVGVPAQVPTARNGAQKRLDPTTLNPAFPMKYGEGEGAADEGRRHRQGEAEAARQPGGAEAHALGG